MNIESKIKKLKRNWLRYFMFIVGFLLLVSPFALVARTGLYLMGTTNNPAWQQASTDIPDIHSTCLRMTVDWIFNGDILERVAVYPLRGMILVLLPIAFLFGPLFCGWLCPAGSFTESLSRLVPSKFKMNLSNASPTAIRYGFLAAFVTLAVGIKFSDVIKAKFSSVCCSYCNFALTNRIIEGAFLLDLRDLFFGHWTSAALITLFLWLFVFGIFMQGGRGFCNFFCPAGALQSLLHFLGSKLRFTYKIRVDQSKCNDCWHCKNSCPVWAIQSGSIKIDRHLCNMCKECIIECNHGALSFSRGP
ncbi:MAG: 4Fe-4S binding protein [Euryarchaeota archaeon]|nr:4Fe-4S binding protein [Euryarchaeota archaeon]